MEKLIVDGVYQHINNGGITFGVTQDEYGVAIEIEATHFGNTTGKTKLYVNRESLENLGNMFVIASKLPELKQCDYFMSQSKLIDKDTAKLKEIGQDFAANAAIETTE